jgi:hypothetical protein
MTYEASATRSVDRDPQNDSLVIIGWITVVLLPLAAIVIGAMLRGRGDRRGTPILAVSIATQVLALIAIAVIVSGWNNTGSSPQALPASKDCIFNHEPSRAELRNCTNQIGDDLRP